MNSDPSDYRFKFVLVISVLVFQSLFFLFRYLVWINHQAKNLAVSGGLAH